MFISLVGRLRYVKNVGFSAENLGEEKAQGLAHQTFVRALRCDASGDIIAWSLLVDPLLLSVWRWAPSVAHILRIP